MKIALFHKKNVPGSLDFLPQKKLNKTKIN